MFHFGQYVSIELESRQVQSEGDEVGLLQNPGKWWLAQSGGGGDGKLRMGWRDTLENRPQDRRRWGD